MLWIIGLLAPDLRQFMPLVPYCVAPIRYDGAKLRRLLASVPATSCLEGLSATVDWLRSQPSPRPF